MPVKLPKSNTQFNSYSNTDLATLAQGIHDGLLASILIFPTPPVLPAALQILITSYITAMNAAIDGSKQSTRVFHSIKFDLQNALRQDSLYVNTIITTMITSGTSYSDAQAIILGTGYALSKDPSPAGPLPAPVITRWGSPAKGQLKMLLTRVPNAKGYIVRLENATTRVFLTFPSTRILITDLVSGDLYVATIATIGSNPTRNFDVQISQIII